MHCQYLRYLARHKWFVLVAACRLGIPVRGLLHDWSKLRPGEWLPYAASFYGPARTPEVRAAFDRAWLLHQHRNAHHWQYWILILDDGGSPALPMPDPVRREMLADWVGAGRAQGFTAPGATRDWYLQNRDRIRLHPDTRAWVEQHLACAPGGDTP
jgi:hypothetical protein